VAHIRRRWRWHARFGHPGALAANARSFSDLMRMAAAIAGLARDDALVPDPLEMQVHAAVAAAVRRAAGQPSGRIVKP
jgi:malic enzyme